MIINPFVRDVDTLKAQLSSLKAEGGGPVQESLLDALYMVIKRGETTKGQYPGSG